MKNVKTIFWDFDGTLVHSSSLWRKAMVRALDLVKPNHSIDLPMLGPFVSKGFPWHEPQIEHRITTSEIWWKRMEKQFPSSFISLGVEEELALRASRLVRREILDPKSYIVFPETLEVLQRFGRDGWQQAIVSNNHPDLLELLVAMDLKKYFSEVIVSGEVGFEKPRAEIFLFAQKLTSSDLQKSWMVGDNLNADILGAESIGLRGILVRSNGSAKYKAEDLLGVERIVKEN